MITTITKAGRVELKKFTSKAGLVQFRVNLEGVLIIATMDYFAAVVEFNKLIESEAAAGR
jgi:hypothetical protein